jgi:hypothetical protein
MLTGCKSMGPHTADSPYDEYISSITVSNKKDKIVIAGKNFDYIIDTPKNVLASFDYSFHSKLLLACGLIKISYNDVSGTCYLVLADTATAEEKNAAQSAGFSPQSIKIYKPTKQPGQNNEPTGDGKKLASHPMELKGERLKKNSSEVRDILAQSDIVTKQLNYPYQIRIYKFIPSSSVIKTVGDAVGLTLAFIVLVPILVLESFLPVPWGN